MDKLTILEAKIAELDKKLSTVAQVTLKESELIDLFLKIESCTDFDSLQELSISIGKMPITKYETLVFALAARIRQNSLTSERLDDTVYAIQKELALLEDKGTFH